MFESKINRNLSEIVYRYEWQYLVNRVNEEYRQEFAFEEIFSPYSGKMTSFVVTKEKYKSSKYKAIGGHQDYYSYKFNYRQLDYELHGNILSCRGIPFRHSINLTKKMERDPSLEESYGRPAYYNSMVNYVYTSTIFIQKLIYNQKDAENSILVD